jgi:hypothetical protein
LQGERCLQQFARNAQRQIGQGLTAEDMEKIIPRDVEIDWRNSWEQRT